MSKFSERLKELRAEKEISQKRLAPLIGYSQQNVSDWEAGNCEPNANALIACAAFFDVTTDFLLGLETESGEKIRISNSFNGSNNGNIVIGNNNRIKK